MHMDSSIILQSTLDCFEKHRKEKGTQFDKESFLDFLLSEPKRIKGIHNSFEGKRRFFSFWKQIQLENGICFSIKDQEKQYSLDKFVSRIEELKDNPKSSKAALRHQMKYGFEWNIFIFMNAILIVLFMLLFQWPFMVAVTLIIIAYSNYKLVSFYFKEKNYLNTLMNKLDQL